MSFSTNQQQGVETSTIIYQGTDPTGFPAPGTTARLKGVTRRFSCSFLSSRADGLLSGQRPTHDAPHLSSRAGASRFRHQSGATDGKTPHILVHRLPDVVVLLLLQLLSAFSQSHDSTQPLRLLPGDPVPLLASDRLWLLPDQQRLKLQLPASAQVSVIMCI